MTGIRARPQRELARRLAEAEATIEALVAGQIDAVVDPRSHSPVLLSKAQDALRESEERYRRIVETSNDGIWSINGESKITFVNQRLADMLGYSPDEMIGKSFSQFIPEASEAKAPQRFEGTRGISQETEVKLERNDQSELWVLLKTSPIRDADGAYVGTLAMMTDRTRAREDEEALRKSEEQYRQIVETTTEGIIKSDASARILFVNRRFAEMLGYDPREMVGVSMFDYMSAAAGDRRRRVPAAAARSAGFRRQRSATRTETTYRSTSPGPRCTMETARTPAISVSSRRNRTEEAAIAADGERPHGFGWHAGAGVAHEINNPLAAVIANLDYMAESLRAHDRWRLGRSRSGKEYRLGSRGDQDAARRCRDAAERVRFIVA
jgi:PAS domain S-box-containing protein